jgi:hypothetical protein
MSDVVRLLLVVVVLFGLYREFRVIQFYLARRRVRREPFRGVVLRFPRRS